MSKLKDKIIHKLNELGFPYEVIEINPEFSDTAIFCKKYGYPAECTCNTIILVSKSEPVKYAACVVQSNTLLDVNKCVRKLLGVRKVSFVRFNEMTELTGMEIGGVTPICLPENIVLYIDERVLSHDWIILGAGKREAKIKTSPEILLKLNGQVVSNLGMKKED